ncbi:MAG TPA: ArsB/NhaD family transporter [Candidatus Limnocylindria bacterium]|nr:ArsB/NhaD family transporter [Candidatus Limnocylindria bacterium]
MSGLLSGDLAFWAAVVVFVLAYALIATERIHKTVAALLGGVAIILLGIVGQEQAFESVDFNVIFLLAGMMVLAAIIRRTGVFGWLAVRAARLAGGDGYRILVVTSLITAIASAFLDNVTTVVLVGPITLFLAARLGLSPLPFIISSILASNIGGAATLIGDPPNILIGSAASLDFVAFLVHMAPLSIVCLALYLLAARWLFGGQLEIAPELRDQLLAMDERQMISDPALLRVSLIVLVATLVGFLFHGLLGYEPGTVALAGATLLLLLSRIEPHEVLREVEWTTLFFFIGLFIMVGGIIEVGVIDLIAERIDDITGGALAPTSFLILWLSAGLSAIIDNIPYTATMIPVVDQLVGSQGHSADVLWWSLAIGADFGGNATIIAASANVTLASLSEREGHPIRFGTFAKYGIPVTLGTMLIATLYVWVRYLL